MNKLASESIYRIIKALAKFMIRTGVSYGEFSKIAKKAFVDSAQEDFALENGKQSISRIAALTGLRRHDVSDISKSKEVIFPTQHTNKNRLALVLRGWLSDKVFLNADQSPKALYLSEQEPSFKTLVLKYSKDITHGTILDDFLQNNTVTIHRNRVKLTNKKYYDESDALEEKSALPIDIAELIETIDNNTNPNKKFSYLQRKIFINNVPQNLLDSYRESSKKLGQSFLEEVHHWHNLNKREDVATEEFKDITIGVYYHEK
jgi:hypothetical protein